MKDTNVRLLGDTVLIKKDEKDLAYNEAGLYVPDSMKGKMISGKVTVIGDDVREVKVGDTVVFGKASARETIILGDSLLIIKENQIELRLI